MNSKSKEQKVAIAIADASEDHWFNPSILGRYLTEQPHYTLDRIIEMVAEISRHAASRYQLEGGGSEGLFLANELNEHIKVLKTKYKFRNLKLTN